ncbi:MAG: DegT/DnrJ/EryC1/StrS family aminotransferase [Rhodanobacter sp.]
MNTPLKSRIYYTKPSITALEIGYATDAASNGWGEHCYDYIHRFETMFCEHLGVKHAIATSSATGALHIGMAAMGIGPGDEVVLADINWIASAAPIVHLGATPALVDVLADSWCLDPAAVEAAITLRTKAILAVHLYGNLCDMDALRDIGLRHGVPVIEDAAEAIGSTWHGHRAGSMGIFGAFSFHGTKTVTTGEGGIFVTDDDDLYEKALTLSNHGRARGEARQFWPETIGFKYKMSNLQAAIGCGQLERIEALIDRKRAIFAAYREALAPVADRIAMNPEHAGTVNGYWMPTVVFHANPAFDRDALLAAFEADHIDGRVFFWPLSQLGIEGVTQRANTPNAHAVHSHAVNLPSYHDIGPDQIERVAKLVCAFA